MLSVFLNDLGPIIQVLLLVVWWLGAAFVLEWIFLWRMERRRVGKLEKDLVALGEAWKGDLPVRQAYARTAGLGYTALLAVRGPAPDAGDPEYRRRKDACLRLLGIFVETAPILGLLLTAVGFFLAFTRLAGAGEGSRWKAMAGPAALALKSTMACLAPTILGLLVPSVLPAGPIEDREKALVKAFQDIVRKRLPGVASRRPGGGSP